MLVFALRIQVSIKVLWCAIIDVSKRYGLANGTRCSFLYHQCSECWIEHKVPFVVFVHLDESLVGGQLVQIAFLFLELQLVLGSVQSLTLDLTWRPSAGWLSLWLFFRNQDSNLVFGLFLAQLRFGLDLASTLR